VVSGPLSFSDSRRYSPLVELIQRINKESINCDILIILGPIIDEDNK